MIQERIRELRKALKYSQSAFGEKLGVSRDVINNLEQARVAPSDLIINMICAKFGVDEHWLRTGEGEMYPEKSEDPLWSMLGEVLKDEKSSFKRQLITSLCQLDDDEIKAFEKVLDVFISNREKSKREEG